MQLSNTAVQQIYVWYLCCMLPSANDYTSHLQDATTGVLAVRQFY